MAVKEMNFYDRYKEQPNKARSTSKVLRVAAPFLIVALLCMGVWNAVFWSNRALADDIDQTLFWCTDQNNVQRQIDALTLLSKDNSIQSGLLEVAGVAEKLASYPQVNAKAITAIVAAGGEKISVQVDSYDSKEGTLLFTARSAEVIDIPAYVKLLEATGMFYQVDYTGYGIDTQDKSYRINVQCVLASTAGKEGA